MKRIEVERQQKLLNEMIELMQRMFGLAKCSYASWTILKTASWDIEKGYFHATVRIPGTLTTNEDEKRLQKFLHDKKLEDYFKVKIIQMGSGGLNLELQFIDTPEHKAIAEEIITYTKMVCYE